ncbi:TatD family hydrolase [Lactovum miscens]|uniref:TatD DNase family protein n=1 Tax=Lactovum miscens TaxID=190387 RepID=A0A841CA67_9LACT|nr:TatD family hydrolase [Lactovum miscens]MBB5888289.1 TatD DNase family protein [Lactovum miscens]
MIKIFDSHTHLNSEQFIGRENELINFAEKSSVALLNNVGVDQETNDWALKLANEFEICYATIGWHPDAASAFDGETEQFLMDNLSNPKVVAIGEIGLDYHWMEAPKWLQEDVFRKQIRISKQFDKPFQVHTREAIEDTYEIIREEGVGSAGAIIHNFSGTYEWAKKFLELGMMISFSGIVTFKKSLGEQEAAAKLPLDRILVETDAPYLTPMPYRGKENQPGYTRYTVEKIAELRCLTFEEVADATFENSMKIFKL